MKLGWFSTARGAASRELLRTVWDKTRDGAINADFAFVFCSREQGESPETDRFLDQVRGYGIPLVCFSSRRFKPGEGHLSDQWRLEYDREVMRRLQGFDPDLCILAGYKLVVGPEMCARYRMVNLHPAAPGGPAGTWQEVIWKLIESRATETGAMMHLVTPELDKGPVVTYYRFSLRGKAFDALWKAVEGKPAPALKAEHGEELPLFKEIRRHGVAREYPLIVATIQAFAEGRVRIADGRITDRAGNTLSGYDLSADVDRAVAGKV